VFLASLAVFLLTIGLLALAAAASVVMLPHEVAQIGADPVFLRIHHHDHTLVSFLIHNRVSFGGALIAIGVLYLWLVQSPLAAGERWSWWTFLLSAGLGAASFLSYLPKGYFDPLHAAGTIVIVVTLICGAIWVRREGLTKAMPLQELPAFLYQRMTVERLLATIWGGGTLLGGIAILFVGMFPVFVAEDQQYLGASAALLHQINPQLVAYIAHDRSGFGGALIALGIMVLGIVWFAGKAHLYSGRRWLVLAWIVSVLTAIGIHPLVGYNSLSHLVPFLLKDGAFALALVLCHQRRIESHD
jgi:hypothetical protein